MESTDSIDSIPSIISIHSISSKPSASRAPAARHSPQDTLQRHAVGGLEQRMVAGLGLKAMVAGTIATLLTGAVIGILLRP